MARGRVRNGRKTKEERLRVRNEREAQETKKTSKVKGNVQK